jgi:hypothetical protein
MTPLTQSAARGRQVQVTAVLPASVLWVLSLDSAVTGSYGVEPTICAR